MIKPIKIEDAVVAEVNNGTGHYVQIGNEIFAVNGVRANGQPGELRWRVVPDACNATEREVIEFFANRKRSFVPAASLR